MHRFLFAIVLALVGVSAGCGVAHASGPINADNPWSWKWDAVSAASTLSVIPPSSGPVPSTRSVQAITSGTVSACTFKVEGSLDGANFFDMSGTLSCASSNFYSVVQRPALWVRITVISFTGTGSVQFFHAGGL